jgi:acetyl-CoA carboxylase biotin carboxyl carrier protein
MGTDVDIRKVKKLIELLEESGLAEIEITEGEESVRISRYGNGVPVAAAMAVAPAPVAAAVETPAAPVTLPAAAASSGTEITAPMVGTYYSAAGPGAKPFVEIGSEIAVGDTLCIIEAMKMMNQIESEVAGRVVNIQIENGEPVEFGQALFIVE